MKKGNHTEAAEAREESPKIVLDTQLISSEVSRALDNISKIFPGSYTFTFVARHNGTLDADVIISNDQDLSAVAASVATYQSKRIIEPL